jgi:uncharacterized protein
MTNAMPDRPDEPQDARATITTQGEATVRVAPDEADVWITLSAVAAAPSVALADVTDRSEGLVALLDELGVATKDRSIGGVSIQEEVEHTQQGRRSLGHRATARASIRATDATLIGRLIADAAERVQAQVSGPHWQVSLGNPARLEAAHGASADAKRKAEAFAEGLGVRLGGVLRVVENAENHRVLRQGARRTALRAAAGQEAVVPIEAGEHDVTSSVEVSFALDLP